MLNKINKDSVQDMVFAQLKKAILDGTFQPGDRLPSENELCAQLGVSRPSVKLAIQRLCTLGMAETRRETAPLLSRSIHPFCSVR